jgi:hypothetical protein
MADTQSNKPSHFVYVVEGKGEESYVTKVGAAWPNKKGTGFNIKLTALPLNARLVMTDASEADMKAKAA